MGNNFQPRRRGHPWVASGRLHGYPVLQVLQGRDNLPTWAAAREVQDLKESSTVMDFGGPCGHEKRGNRSSMDMPVFAASRAAPT